ncbi:MAG TPA: hypothetical protein VFX59_01560 [Polyangiales bacterium]|nr:hypothetical protein [Polyangiales bacterium]
MARRSARLLRARATGGALAFALTFAACSNEFLILEQRLPNEPDGEAPRDAGSDPGSDAGNDASLVDANVRDARVQDANPPPDAMVPEGANVVSSFAQSCAVVNGSLYCWGADDFGQAGVLGTGAQRKPVKLADEPFTDVCAGERHSCALRADGTTLCWGSNVQGQLGVGDVMPRETPAPLDVRRFATLSCGGWNTCALAPRGELWCWGDNSEGKLGQNDPGMGQTGTLPLSTAPTPVLTNTRFAQVSVGQGHVCALSEQGRVYCWGRNNWGQLGIAEPLEQTRTPTPVAGDTQFVSVAAGQNHSCAVDIAGGLWCWGQPANGLLGLTTNQAMVRVPTKLDGDDFASVTANWLHSCALKKNGTLYCWGRGEEGQLGGGDSSLRTAPTQVVGHEGRWRSVNAGQFHTCAFASDGLFCWGANDTGQLGQSDDARRYVPIKLNF